jgi:regulator of protease activity HflC (stomatin/prohibitin superfamily)
MFVIIAAIVVVGAVLIGTAVRQIPAGEVGVVDFFGTVQEKPITQGFNFVKPLSGVQHYSIKTQQHEYKQIEDTLTSEGLNLVPDFTVYYRILGNATPSLYQTVQGDPFETLVTPIFMGAVRDEMKKWTAEAIYTGTASLIQADVQKRLQNDSRLTTRGIIIESVVLRGVKLPDKIKSAIEAKITESQAVDQMKFSVLKQEQENKKIISAAQAQAEANRVLAASITPTLVSMEYVKALRENQNVIFAGSSGNGMMIDATALVKNG